ncbi:MAG TPA: zinc-binding alcohol dehydrogenase family protein, partial [Chthonomonadaceae bacterium]|nr:zinc-binding alcohol dehydrogenase family protein [Chthonomonadaceae bacterium]
LSHAAGEGNCKQEAMKTITLEQPGQFSLSETDAPAAIEPGEALVRVRRVGICGTDLHAYHGRQPFFSYPRILGHELGVEIVEIGPNDQGLRAGDTCAVEPYLNCGHCIACRRGKTNCCADLKVLGVHTDGGMREVIRVPARKLHRSDRLSLDQLALVETLGIGAHAVDRARLESGEFALVIGAGPIGLTVIQFAQAAGAQVIALDVNANRLDFCRQQMGVEFALPADAGAPERVKEITHGDMPTAVFDATGSAASMQQAFDYVAPGGRLTLVGLVRESIAFYDPDFHRREITLLATRNSTSADFNRILSMLESGRIDTSPWITHRAPCTQMIAQFPRWLEPDSGLIKAVVEF